MIFTKCVIILSLTLFRNFVEAPKVRTKISTPQMRAHTEDYKVLRCDPNYEGYDFEGCQDAQTDIPDDVTEDDAEADNLTEADNRPGEPEPSEEKIDNQYEENSEGGSDAVTTEDNEYQEEDTEGIAVHQDTLPDDGRVTCNPPLTFECPVEGAIPYCISKSKVCDGKVDCPEGGDESDCDTTTATKTTETDTGKTTKTETTKPDTGKTTTKTTNPDTDKTTTSKTTSPDTEQTTEVDTTQTDPDETTKDKITTQPVLLLHTSRTPSTVIIWEKKSSPTSQKLPPDVDECYEQANCRFPFGLPNTTDDVNS